MGSDQSKGDVEGDKVDAMPPNAYEQGILENKRRLQEALPLPTFVCLGASHSCHRAPNPSALPMRRMVAGPGRPEGRRNPCQDAGCSASACAQEAVRRAAHTTLRPFARDRGGTFIR